MFHWVVCIRIIRLYSSDLSKPTTKSATNFFKFMTYALFATSVSMLLPKH